MAEALSRVMNTRYLNHLLVLKKEGVVWGYTSFNGCLKPSLVLFLCQKKGTSKGRRFEFRIDLTGALK